VRTARALALTLGALSVLLLVGPSASATNGRIVELSLQGVVDPFTADYLKGGIQSAQDQGANAVLITIDTPGGLSSSMRDITQAILNSPIPVITYVFPEGARAASAGTFILMAGSVAAMAPGTNVGAAHPVGVSGATEQTKVLNDAVASIRAIAEARDRNADWAEQAVRQSVSVSAEEALRLDVIDLIEPDVPSLLKAVNGRTVPVNGGRTVVLDTTGATIEEQSMGVMASILHGLLSPDLAFIFFYLGVGLIVLEFLHPGIGLAAVFGVLSLVASFVAFGALPVQLIGILLLVGSVVSFLLELKAPGVGIFTAVGVILLIAGALTLFNPSVPNAQVSPWVIIPVAAVAVLFFGFVAGAIMQARRMPKRSPVERLKGQEGMAATALTPIGVVLLGSEEWSAESTAGPLPEGTKVVVESTTGLRLRVHPVGPNPDESSSGQNAVRTAPGGATKGAE